MFIYFIGVTTVGFGFHNDFKIFSYFNIYIFTFVIYV